MVKKILQIRSEYTSARLIFSNLEHRLKESRFKRHPGYLPPEVDYRTEKGKRKTIKIRDYDVRELNPTGSPRAIEHLSLILVSRQGHTTSIRLLKSGTRKAFAKISVRFTGKKLVENNYVVPYTTSGSYSEVNISNKGAILLDLSNRGIATADFSLLTASVYSLPPKEAGSLRKTSLYLQRLPGSRVQDLPASTRLIPFIISI